MNKSPQRWKCLALILILLSLILLGMAFLPFESVYRFLSQFEADGSFDSLREPVYQTLTLVFRIFAVAGLALAALTIGYRDRVNIGLNDLLQQGKDYSLREDLGNVWAALRPQRGAYWFAAGIGIVTLIGFILRLAQISGNIAYDEAYSFLYYASRSLRYIVTDYSAPNNHILNSLLMSLSWHLWGNQPWIIRLPAFIAGVGCIPAVYLAGRGLYNRSVGLLSAGLVAVSPILISYSTNARGYSLTCLFTLLILAAAAYLRRQNSLVVWVGFVICSILGFYAVPVMLYPFGAVLAWMVVDALTRETRPEHKKIYLRRLAIAIIAIGLTTLLLYSPVIIFGTGYRSIIVNGVVAPQSWNDFTENLMVKSVKIWDDWNTDLFPFSGVILCIGFLFSFLFHFKSSKGKIHFGIPAIIWILAIITIQRVTPWTRVWQFLLIFLFIWASAGWVDLFSLIPRQKFARWGMAAILIIAIGLPGLNLTLALKDPALFHHGPGPEKEAAMYLQDRLTSDDVVVAGSPENVEVMYYLSQYGYPMTRLYNKDRIIKFTQAFVLASEKYNQTLESITQRNGLDGLLDLSKARLEYQARQLSIYLLHKQP